MSSDIFLLETRVVLDVLGIGDDALTSKWRPRFAAISVGYGMLMANIQAAPNEQERERFYRELTATTDKLERLLQRLGTDTNLGRELAFAAMRMPDDPADWLEQPAIGLCRDAQLSGRWSREPTEAEADELAKRVVAASTRVQESREYASHLARLARDAEELLARAVYDRTRRTKRKDADRWLIGELAVAYFEITAQPPTAYRDRAAPEEPIDTEFVHFVLAFVDATRRYLPNSEIKDTFIADNISEIRKERGLPAPAATGRRARTQ